MKLKDLILLLFFGTLIWCLTIDLFVLRNVDDVLDLFRGFDASADVRSFFVKAPVLQERLFLVDRKLLEAYRRRIAAGDGGPTRRNCIFCNVKKYQPVTFALLCPTNSSLEEHVLLPILKAWEIGFWVEIIISSKPRKFSLYHANLPLGFILQKGSGALVIEIVLLHEREGDFWWHGSFHQDVDCDSKLSNLRVLGIKEELVLNEEGAFDKLQIKSVDMDGSKVNVPSDVDAFLAESTKFVECDYELADRFYRTYGKDTTSRALKFVHRARKILSAAKFLLDELRVPFWISSGTLLGYYRQCDVIPYAGDVDIGVFIRDYRSDIVDRFRSGNLKLKHRFGRVNDSFELSFALNQVKLDIFFFYDDGRFFWNGAHSIRWMNKTAYAVEKYKYSFPKFTLCWTEFLDMKVRIPCETETYVRANYGPNWFTPIPKWNYVVSPYNVEKMGEWRQSELSEVFKIY